MDLVKDFINYKKRVKGYSPHTIISYQQTLYKWQSFLEKEFNKAIIEATHTEARAFVVEMYNRGFVPITINHHIKILKTFYKHCRRSNEMIHNPTGKIKLLKEPKRLPVYIKKEDIIRILDGLSTYNRKTLRDRLAIELLYCTGVRINELINIKITDINFNDPIIKIMGKGSKERIVFLMPHLIDLIQLYLKSWKHKRKTHYLLMTNDGTKVYPMYVNRLITKHFKPFITGQVTPHTFRHSFATHLLQEGAPIKGISLLLGHSGLGSTQIYLHLQEGDIKGAHKFAHPKG